MGSATRDDGLRRLSSVTRWVAAGGIAVAGVLSGLVAHAQPGRASASTQPATVVPPSRGDEPSADDNQGFSELQPPAQNPASSNGPPVVVSGAS
jgi:hypothetical protein